MGALVLPKLAEVLSFGIDDSTSIVVGEGLFVVFLEGFWTVVVARAESPRV